MPRQSLAKSAGRTMATTAACAPAVGVRAAAAPHHSTRPSGPPSSRPLCPAIGARGGRRASPRGPSSQAAFGSGGDRKESEKAAPNGLQVLFQKALEGGKKVSKEPDGFTRLMQSLGDGIVERNFGTGGSWPDAAEAKRKGVCPRCGASTAEALKAAEEAGTAVDPGSDPVELAAVGQHPLGWCKGCATKDRLLDVSQSF